MIIDSSIIANHEAVPQPGSVNVKGPETKRKPPSIKEMFMRMGKDKTERNDPEGTLPNKEVRCTTTQKGREA